jgi:ABC-type oligopeptide transport system ATPase subunit
MKASDDALIEVHNLTKVYPYGKRRLIALNHTSLSIRRGETLGIVGESGSGKSTLGKVMVRLEEPTGGTIYYKGTSINTLSASAMQQLRRKIQMIFQDPYASLDPRMTILESIAEGIDIHKLCSGSSRRDRIAMLLEQVGLEPSMMQRYPHEFSGGQRQRICIARALAVDPEFIVCDEPLSALDSCTQKQVMELLQRLKRDYRLTYLFISHDLNAVRQIADNVAVMYLGNVVEYAPAKTLFAKPSHPYTQALLSAIPIADPILERQRKPTIFKGELPSSPILREIAPGHYAACH